MLRKVGRGPGGLRVGVLIPGLRLAVYLGAETCDVRCVVPVYERGQGRVVCVLAGLHPVGCGVSGIRAGLDAYHEVTRAPLAPQVALVIRSGRSAVERAALPVSGALRLGRGIECLDGIGVGYGYPAVCAVLVPYPSP